MVSDRVNNDLTLPVLASFDANELLVPAQALVELFTVLTRKAKGPAGRARAAVLAWHDACLVADTTSSVLLEAYRADCGHNHDLEHAT